MFLFTPKCAKMDAQLTINFKQNRGRAPEPTVFSREGNNLDPTVRWHGNINPSLTKGGGGKITPQTDLFAAISEPLGFKGNALVTFPKYVLTTEWHIFRNYIPTLRS